MTGSINSTCQKYGGQCYCKPGVTGRTCDQCVAGFYNFTSQGCSGNLVHSYADEYTNNNLFSNTILFRFRDI